MMGNKKVTQLQTQSTTLQKEFDALCRKIKIENRPKSRSRLGAAPSKGRGRPPLSSVQKLNIVHEKLRKCSSKMVKEADKVLSELKRNVRAIEVEIDSKQRAVATKHKKAKNPRAVQGKRSRQNLKDVDSDENEANEEFIIPSNLSLFGRGRKGRKSGAIANRLRKRQRKTSSRAPKPRTKRWTRSMVKIEERKSDQSSEEIITTNTRKRDAKSIEKLEQLELEDGKVEEIKQRFENKYLKRDRYYSQIGSIYNRYDEYIKKRKKDKRIKFINDEPEKGETPLTKNQNRQLQKKFNEQIKSQDTF